MPRKGADNDLRCRPGAVSKGPAGKPLKGIALRARADALIKAGKIKVSKSGG